jgi:hypothetical protein
LLNGKSIGFLPLLVHLSEDKESQQFGLAASILVIDESSSFLPGLNLAVDGGRRPPVL